MATLNFDGKSYACAHAQKGSDFIRLLDGNGKVVLFAEGISNFSRYELVDGSWENPMAVVAPTVSAHATLSNALIVLDVPAFVNIETGLHITFVAPCSCDAATGVSINGTAYTLVDAMGNTIASLGGAFCLGAVVSIILDTVNARAYIQNAASAASSASPVKVSEDGYTDISGLRQLTSGKIVRNGQTITITTVLDGDETHIDVITLDDNEFPIKIVSDGREVPWEWSGFNNEI